MQSMNIRMSCAYAQSMSQIHTYFDINLGDDENNDDEKRDSMKQIAFLSFLMEKIPIFCFHPSCVVECC